MLGHDPLPSEEIRRKLSTGWPRVLIHKKEPDAFSNPNTDAVLDALAPERIAVYGVALDFCVRCVIDGLLERGHRQITLLTDATRSIYADAAERMLQRWSAAGVQLETTEGLLSEIETPARVAVG